MQDTDNENIYLTHPAFIEFIDRYGSHKLVVAIQFHLEFYASLPYVTYGDFENDEKSNQIKKLMEATNIGRQEAVEYCELVGRYLSKEGDKYRWQGSQNVIDSDIRYEKDYVSDERFNFLNLSLLDLVHVFEGSKRLRNRIATAEEMTHIPIRTVADYIYAGQEAKNIILNIPSMGVKTANELDELIHTAFMKYDMGANSSEGEVKDCDLSTIDSSIKEWEYDAFDMEQIIVSSGNRNLKLSEITEKLPGVLQKSFNEREYNILKYRAINEYTLERIARSYNLTKERIRQIEAEAARRILRLYGKVLEIVIDKLDEELDKYHGDMPLSRASEILGVTSDLLMLLIYVLFRKRGRIRVKECHIVRVDRDSNPLQK